MNKTELLNRFSKDSEERVVLARVLDQMERAQRRSIPLCHSVPLLRPARGGGASAGRQRAPQMPVHRRL